MSKSLCHTAFPPARTRDETGHCQTQTRPARFAFVFFSLIIVVSRPTIKNRAQAARDPIYQPSWHNLENGQSESPNSTKSMGEGVVDSAAVMCIKVACWLARWVRQVVSGC